jgi:hypothetical protein
LNWLPEEMVNEAPGYQTQPHFTIADSGYICLTYAHSTNPDGTTYDIYFELLPGPLPPSDTTTGMIEHERIPELPLYSFSIMPEGLLISSRSPTGIMDIYDSRGNLVTRLEIQSGKAYFKTTNVCAGMYFAVDLESSRAMKFLVLR